MVSKYIAFQDLLIPVKVIITNFPKFVLMIISVVVFYYYIQQWNKMIMVKEMLLIGSYE